MEAQLAESLDLSQVMRYLEDPNWWVEQKLDGHRILVVINDPDDPLNHPPKHSILNRNGKPYTKPFGRKVWYSLHGMKNRISAEHVIYDGELVDGKLWLFDLLYLDDLITVESPYRDRRKLLQSMHDAQLTDVPDDLVKEFQESVGIVPVAKDEEKKKELTFRVLKSGGEGVILKNKEAPYRPGVRSHDMLKVKFVSEAEVIVSEVGRKGKDSLRLHIYRDNQLVEVGACSSIGKEPVEVGDVITVRYLYLGADERLVQPRMMRKREDKEAQDCTWGQLKAVNKEVLTL